MKLFNHLTVFSILILLLSQTVSANEGIYGKYQGKGCVVSIQPSTRDNVILFSIKGKKIARIGASKVNPSKVNFKISHEESFMKHTVIGRGTNELKSLQIIYRYPILKRKTYKCFGLKKI